MSAQNKKLKKVEDKMKTILLGATIALMLVVCTHKTYAMFGFGHDKYENGTLEQYIVADKSKKGYYMVRGLDSTGYSVFYPKNVQGNMPRIGDTVNILWDENGENPIVEVEKRAK